MNQKINFGETIGYGDSYLEFLFGHFKVLRIYFITLLEQLGHIVAKVQATFTWLGVTKFMFAGSHDWTTFCLYIKIFLPSIFNSVDFRSSMSCIVLDFELPEKNIIQEVGVFINGKVQGYSFRPPKMYKPTREAFWSTRNLQELVWNSGRLDYSELSSILPRTVEGEFLLKDLENARFLAIYWIKRWKTWKITAVPKFKISLTKNFGFARVTHSDTRPHITVQSVKKNCLITGQCGIECCRICNVKCIVTIYENKSFETIQFFSPRFVIEILSVQGRWLIKMIILIQVKMSYRQQSREKIVGLFGTNLFQLFNCVLVPTFCDFVDYFWLPLENSSSKILCRIHCSGGKSV